MINRTALHRTFRNGFTAEDVAEALVSYDFDQPGNAVRNLMAIKDFDVAGVRFAGVTGGWVAGNELGDGQCGDHAHDLGEALLIDARTPLAEVLDRLGGSQFLLVTALGAVAGIVTRADLQKPPVRMWLFGIVTLIEDMLLRWIDSLHPEGTWHGQLSPARVRKAETLHAERRRRNESLELVDCLSFGDKLWILSKSRQFLEKAEFPSRRVARERMKELEQLRNRLAHGQGLTSGQLMVAARLARNLERLLEMVADSEEPSTG